MDQQTQVPESQVKSTMPSANSGQIQIAGAGRRFAASLIDNLIFWLILIILISVGIFLGSVIQGEAYSVVSVVFSVLAFVWGVFFIIIYYPLFEGLWGASLGKRILSLKVVQTENLNAQGLGIGNAIIRYLVSIGSGWVLNIGHFWVFLNPERQAWQDLATKSYVVYDPSKNFKIDNVEKISKRDKNIVAFVIFLVITILFNLMIVVSNIFISLAVQGLSNGGLNY